MWQCQRCCCPSPAELSCHQPLPALCCMAVQARAVTLLKKQSMGAWTDGNYQLEINGDTDFLKALQDHHGCFCWMCKLHVRERNATYYPREHQILDCHSKAVLFTWHWVSDPSHHPCKEPAIPRALGSLHPPLEQGDPAAMGAVTSDTAMPALPVAWLHSPLSCLSLRVPPAAGSCQVPVCLRSSHWWAHSSPACAAASLRALLWAVPTVPSSPQPQTLPPALPQEQLHKPCSGMESGGFGLCDHRAEGSAALFGGSSRSVMLQHPQHSSPAPTCPAARRNPLPSLPLLVWHNLGDWGNPWSWVGEGHF